MDGSDKNKGGVVVGLLSLSLSNNTSSVQIAIVAKQKIEPWIWMPAKFQRTSMQLPNQILRLPWTAPYDDKADINDEDDDGEEEDRGGGCRGGRRARTSEYVTPTRRRPRDCTQG